MADWARHAGLIVPTEHRLVSGRPVAAQNFRGAVPGHDQPVPERRRAVRRTFDPAGQ